MVILEHEIRWQRLWWFLSLDCARPFFQDMWVPVEDPAEFQKQLQARLSEVGERGPYSLHPELSNAAVQSWFSSSYTLQNQELILHWAERVYVSGGSDRVGEDLWGHIVARALVGAPEDAPRWAVEIFEGLHRKKLADVGTLQERIEAEFARRRTEWDQVMISGEAAEREGEQYEVKITKENSVKTTIRLIAGLNLFVRWWEVYCSGLNREQLITLYELGQRAAAEANLADQGVAYPGSWRFELRPFIDRIGQ